MGNGPQSPGNHYILGVGGLKGIPPYGANALGLQRVLGLGSYKTAWVWLHKLRRAMVRPDRDQLSGVVQVDESYVGGVEAGVRGRETTKKAIVAIAAEVDGFGLRVPRMRFETTARIPANRLRLSDYCDTMESDIVRRQVRQIVQS